MRCYRVWDSKIVTVWREFLKLLFPPALYCICCGNIVDESRPYFLCDHCRSHIRWKTTPPKEMNDMESISCTQYGIYERRIIFHLKYNRKTYIGEIIGDIFKDRLDMDVCRHIRYDLIIPVPMDKNKEKRRGFNHAYLMAKPLGRENKTPVYADVLMRIKPTKPMRGLGPYERKENVSNAFAVASGRSHLLMDKTVLLVDDFHTTGSTVDECKRVLLEAGAKKVIFICFASKNL